MKKQPILVIKKIQYYKRADKRADTSEEAGQQMETLFVERYNTTTA